MNHKTIFAFLLCLVLFASLFAFPAFADNTVIVIGAAANPNPLSSTGSSTSGTTVVLSGGSGTIASDGSVNPSSTASSGSAVVVMSDGTVQTVSRQLVSQAQSVSAQTAVAETASASAPVVVEEQSASSQATTTIQPSAGLATEILTLINQKRAENGLSAMKYSEALQEAADIRAKESATNFSHIRPDGRGCETAVTVDYMVTGENLIQVTSEFATAAIMVDTWMNSPTHRNNILLKDFSEMAVGLYVANGITYVSTVFAGY